MGFHLGTFVDKKILIFSILFFEQICKLKPKQAWIISHSRSINLYSDLLPLCIRYRGHTNLPANFRGGLQDACILPRDELFHQDVKQVAQKKIQMGLHLQDFVARIIARIHHCWACRDYRGSPCANNRCNRLWKLLVPVHAAIERSPNSCLCHLGHLYQQASWWAKRGWQLVWGCFPENSLDEGSWESQADHCRLRHCAGLPDCILHYDVDLQG